MSYQNQPIQYLQLQHLHFFDFHNTSISRSIAVTWALMELFWTNGIAAMAARPRPLPPPRSLPRG
ncbi:hypothetical protein J6590_068992 [Homalodisca vitripennis]|nr:hypothetical protein J6590_068992 [Homalodisca vitripennis]